MVKQSVRLMFSGPSSGAPSSDSWVTTLRFYMKNYVASRFACVNSVPGEKFDLDPGEGYKGSNSRASLPMSSATVGKEAR